LASCKKLGDILTDVSLGFHRSTPSLQRVLDAKKRDVQHPARAFDWATAEALAFGTLLNGG
jgi:2-oxoglutarate dehydrogenase E1 component